MRRHCLRTVPPKDRPHFEASAQKMLAIASHAVLQPAFLASWQARVMSPATGPTFLALEPTSWYSWSNGQYQHLRWISPWPLPCTRRPAVTRLDHRSCSCSSGHTQGAHSSQHRCMRPRLRSSVLALACHSVLAPGAMVCNLQGWV